MAIEQNISGVTYWQEGKLFSYYGVCCFRFNLLLKCPVDLLLSGDTFSPAWNLHSTIQPYKGSLNGQHNFARIICDTACFILITLLQRECEFSSVSLCFSKSKRVNRIKKIRLLEMCMWLNVDRRASFVMYSCAKITLFVCGYSTSFPTWRFCESTRYFQGNNISVWITLSSETGLGIIYSLLTVR